MYLKEVLQADVVTSIPISPPHRFQSSLQQCQNESSYVRGSSLNLLHPPLPHPITTEMDSGTMNEHCGEVNASSGVDLKERPVLTEMSSTSDVSVVDQNEGSEKCVSVNECNSVVVVNGGSSVVVMNGGNSNDTINKRKLAVVVNGDNSNDATNERNFEVVMSEGNSEDVVDEGNSSIPSNECNSMQMTNECNSLVVVNDCMSTDVVNEGNSSIPSNECNSMQMTNECNSLVVVNDCMSTDVVNEGMSTDVVNESISIVTTNECNSTLLINENNSPLPSNECSSTPKTNECTSTNVVDECNSTQETKECISPPPSNDQSTPQSHPSFFSLLKKWFHFFYPVSNKHITHPSQRTLHPLLLTPITSPHHSPLVPSDPSTGHSTATLQCLPRQSGVAPEGSIASPRTPSSSPDSQFSSLHILKIGGSHELPAC